LNPRESAASGNILRAATPRAWVDAAIEDLPALLVDHSNCEKKAASTALALIFAYPEDRSLSVALSRLAREELKHFEQVERLMKKLDISHVRMKPGRYASELRKLVRTHEPKRKLDLMIVHALIEARSCERFRLLATRLPEDVRVRSAEEVDSGFHARFSARGKAYRYRISNTAVMSPFDRRFALHISRALDLAAIRDAAQLLLGEHDFACFQARSEHVRSSVRTVTRSEWSEEPLPDGGRLLTYEIAGSGFLKYMVRNIVGTLVEVGDGHRTPASLGELLASKSRAAAGPTAPPQGLYLVRVDYDAAAPVSSSSERGGEPCA
jgi:tRNA pseudouridine(38-40) synthase